MTPPTAPIKREWIFSSEEDSDHTDNNANPSKGAPSRRYPSSDSDSEIEVVDNTTLIRASSPPPKSKPRTPSRPSWMNNPKYNDYDTSGRSSTTKEISEFRKGINEFIKSLQMLLQHRFNTILGIPDFHPRTKVYFRPCPENKWAKGENTHDDPSS